jgi:hypothetical protein
MHEPNGTIFIDRQTPSFLGNFYDSSEWRVD